MSSLKRFITTAISLTFVSIIVVYCFIRSQNSFFEKPIEITISIQKNKTTRSITSQIAYLDVTTQFPKYSAQPTHQNIASTQTTPQLSSIRSISVKASNQITTAAAKRDNVPVGDFHHVVAVTKLQTFLSYASKSMVSAEDRILYRTVIKTFCDFCDQNNLTYFIYSGTLIGSYRHHGFVPWDDDFDVFFNDSDREKIKSIFTNKLLIGSTKLVLNTDQRIRWKVFMDIPKAKKAGGYVFKWPYIDICFFKDDGTYLRDTGFGDRYKKSDIYPLTRRPFEGMMLRCPRCTSNILSQNMKSQCCPNNWNHKDEHGLGGSGYCIECQKLQGLFPFVRRKNNNVTTFNETLYLGNNIIGSIVQSDCVPVN